MLTEEQKFNQLDASLRRDANMDDRRIFSRILFEANAQLYQKDQEWNTRILDLSLNGALVKKPDEFQSDEKSILLNFLLPESDIELNIEMEIVHLGDNFMGLKCLHADIESISHLRRLIELNHGDVSLLNRELDLFMKNIATDSH